MCGIFGSTNISEHSTWSQKALEALNHRGPDDQNIWYDFQSHVMLGHTRLSIVDLSPNGKQPMTSISQRYVISYNGEIYNYLEVKKLLRAEGVTFVGNSDTEVILAAIENWGLNRSISYFVGMFVFALWDRKEKKLHLVRDRAGIKPLYYMIHKGSFIFSSEMRPLMLCDDFPKEVNHNALLMLMKYKYIPCPYSIFKNIHKLNPATILTVALSSFPKIQTTKYWSFDKITTPHDMINDPIQAEEMLELQLKQTIKQHNIADVPVGAFLSGGIDSATIVALMQKTLNTTVQTFTVGFNSQGYDESLIAQKIANHLQTNHTSVYLSQKEILEQVPNLPSAYDEPFADSSQIPTLLVSKIAKKYVKVVLSGDGADELFGGYNRYIFAPKIWNIVQHLPFRKHLGKLILKMPHSIWNNRNERAMQWKMAEKIDKIARIFTTDTTDIYESLISCWQQQQVIPKSNVVSIHNNGNCLLTNMMCNDFLCYLPNDILTKVDRATMFHSIEARVPYLDHRLIELAWRFPISMKIKKNQGKHILRRVLYKHVPEHFFDQPKMGFALPLHKWLRTSLRDWAEDLLHPSTLKEQGFFNVELVRQKWEDHLSGKKNYQDHIWTVLMFQQWFHKYMR